MILQTLDFSSRCRSNETPKTVQLQSEFIFLMANFDFLLRQWINDIKLIKIFDEVSIVLKCTISFIISTSTNSTFLVEKTVVVVVSHSAGEGPKIMVEPPAPLPLQTVFSNTPLYGSTVQERRFLVVARQEETYIFEVDLYQFTMEVRLLQVQSLDTQRRNSAFFLDEKKQSYFFS